jgi:hypothetical protein
MYWLRSTFLDYCQRKGINLLKDDLKFIEKLLRLFPPDRQKSIMVRYCEEWHKGMAECENAAQSENFGRRRANLYLNSLV